MPLLVFGVLLGKRTEPFWKGLGQVLLGVGMLFLGIRPDERRLRQL